MWRCPATLQGSFESSTATILGSRKSMSGTGAATVPGTSWTSAAGAETPLLATAVISSRLSAKWEHCVNKSLKTMVPRKDVL